jgi:hypothetical protein
MAFSAAPLKLAHSAFQETPAGRMKASCLPLPVVQMLCQACLMPTVVGFPYPLVLGFALYSIFGVNGFGFDFSP